MAKSVQARLAAKVSGDAGDAPATEAGEAPMGIGADESDTGTPVVETAVDVAGGAPPRAAGDDAAAAVSTAEDPEAKERAARVALFNEKLATARERRHAARLAERAKADRSAAKAERDAAAAERAKWDKIGKEGTYLDGIKELGRDPRAEWEAMNKEAIEAGTPEAQAKRDREALQREIDAKLTPLQQEVERLRAEREQFTQQAQEHRLVTNFTSALSDPSLKDLRIEYSDDALLETVRALIKNPDVLYETAQKRSVPLTNPEKGFTMQEILKVLAAEQAAHDQGKQARRAAQSPPEPQSGAPTVNGTAPRRNAGTAIGNDLASQRASAKAEVSGLSPQERLRQRQAAEIRRGS